MVDIGIIKQSFLNTYGADIEVCLPEDICIGRDSCASPFSSGSNGYLTKIRLNGTTGKFEVYVDWWRPGWRGEDSKEFKKFGLRAIKTLGLKQTC